MKKLVTNWLYRLRQTGRSVAALSLLGGALLASRPAQAQVAYATGGYGKYKNNIAWLTWGGGTNGTHNVLLTPGTTNTTTIAVGSSSLVVTTTIDNFTAGDLKSYCSGSYNGDGLDDNYNIGGNAQNNKLVAGIENVTANTSVSFRLTLSATFDGVPIRIPSIVMADAEVSTNAEYLETTADGKWSAIEVISRCTNACNATVSAASGTIQTLRLSNPNQSCGVSQAGPDGIMSLAFNPTAYTNGQATLNATVKGEGKTAMAIGLLLPFDYGDAPASTYGYAVHLIPQIFNNQLAAASTTDINAAGYSFATLTSPTLRLGALIDADNNSYIGSATLAEDDNNFGAGGTNDEDGITFGPIPTTNVPLTQTVPTYSVKASVYNATSQAANLVGWIDWNNNGTFDPSEAATASVPSTGGSTSVTLTWNNQTLVGTYGQRGIPSRFRVTTDALTARTPSGGASNGEVEDYYLAFSQPLPVTLVSFSATAAEGCAVDLSWQSASEANSARYEVQRSADGTTFTALASVTSANRATGEAYHYRDPQPLPGLAYYRLRLVDLDGSDAYGPVAATSLACGTTQALSLVPNPATSAVSVQGLVAGQLLRVYAADGRLVHTGRATESVQSLDLTGWPQGLYLVHVRNADGTRAATLRLARQ